MKDKWIENLRDQLEEFEMNAPEGLWDNIVSEEKRRNSSEKYTKLHRWLFLAGAAATFVAVITIGFIFRSTDVIHEDFNNINPIALEKADKGISDIKERHNNTWHHIAKIRYKGNTLSPVSSCIDIANSIDLNPTIANITETETNSTSVEEKTHDSIPPIVVDKRKQQRNDIQRKTKTSISSSNRLSFAVYSAGLTEYSHSNKAINNQLATADAAIWSSSWEDRPTLGILTFNQGRMITTDIKHRLPFRTGLSVAYTLNQRIALVAGLSYANLKSDLRSGTDTHYFDGVQTLHYLGVPLSLKIDLLKWRRFQLYTSAGVLTEKCISGKTVTNYVLDNNSREKRVTNINEHPFQFSANASAGLQFNITDIIALYGEPGVSYFFKDGSSLRTIYKDRPFNFNLNIGFRFTLNN